ncbi:MAG TPA: hypothetical protein VF510_09785, partial [Ktedonobacterales bacterium]
MKQPSRADVGHAADQNGAATLTEPSEHSNEQNGHSQLDTRALLYGLQAMRDGDFSVRLPGDWTGL